MRRQIETLDHDLRYALRSFRRSPSFVLVALLSLTLGIGATSAIFSVIHGVLITPYPYARPHEIWAPAVRPVQGRGGHQYTPDEFRQMHELPGVADVMATTLQPVLMTGEFAPESLTAVFLSPNAFEFLGVPPVAGRTFGPGDIRPDGQAEPVVVISHRLWLRLFSGDPGAVGRSLRLNGRPYTIVGVMPPRFGWYGNDRFWLPLAPARRDILWVNPIMRLSPGTSSAAAREQLHSLHLRLAKETPGTFPAQGFTTALDNYLDVTVASGEMRTTLRLLLGAVGFLLLIACANVANLQLARGTSRSREIAVRASIGAGRRRLVRQLLTESLLLSVAGGVLGVLFAYAATSTIVGLMPEFYVPNESRVTINTPVLLFTLGVSLLTGIVFGLVPALQTARADVTEALKSARSTGAGGHGRRTRNVLVVAEVALSVVLLASAGLMIRTFRVLQQTDVGIDADRVLMLGVPLAAQKYSTLEQRNQFAHELLQRVSALPGVEAATLGNGGVPFGGPQTPMWIVGQAQADPLTVTLNLVGPDHLRAFGIPLRRGRMFDATEVRRGDRVALVNEAALRLWPAGEEAMGSRLKLGLLERPPSSVFADPALPPDVTVIGVMANTRNAGVRDEPSPVVLLPYTVLAPPQRSLAVRSAGDPLLLLNPIRAQVRAMDPDQPLGRPITVPEVLGQQIIQPRFTMALFSTFGVLGLALAAAGIYSVLSFHVLRRTHELGVRMALGAPRRHVLGLLLGMGGRLVGFGLVLGIPASLAATRLLRSQLYGVTPSDPAAYAGVALSLAAVAFVACYLPARRAASVDPLVALRQD